MFPIPPPRNDVVKCPVSFGLRVGNPCLLISFASFFVEVDIGPRTYDNAEQLAPTRTYMLDNVRVLASSAANLSAAGGAESESHNTPQEGDCIILFDCERSIHDRTDVFSRSRWPEGAFHGHSGNGKDGPAAKEASSMGAAASSLTGAGAAASSSLKRAADARTGNSKSCYVITRGPCAGLVVHAEEEDTATSPNFSLAGHTDESLMIASEQRNSSTPARLRKVEPLDGGDPRSSVPFVPAASRRILDPDLSAAEGRISVVAAEKISQVPLYNVLEEYCIAPGEQLWVHRCSVLDLACCAESFAEFVDPSTTRYASLGEKGWLKWVRGILGLGRRRHPASAPTPEPPGLAALERWEPPRPETPSVRMLSMIAATVPGQLNSGERAKCSEFERLMASDLSNLGSDEKMMVFCCGDGKDERGAAVELSKNAMRIPVGRWDLWGWWGLGWRGGCRWRWV